MSVDLRNVPVYQEMAKLNGDILHCAHKYFVEEVELVPNHVYDEMVEQFEKMCEANPKIAELFETANKPVPLSEPTGETLSVVRFATPMLSLLKALRLETVDAFIASVGLKPKDLFYELKIDGLALELNYVDGDLKTITTRGDGLVGEDVTHALPLFSESLPRRFLDSSSNPVLGNITVRGEGFIFNFDYDAYQSTAVVPKADPRNAVSGWVRAGVKNQDKEVMGMLQFATYYCNVTFDCKSYKELRTKLLGLGFFPAPECTYEAIVNNDRSVTLPTDGIVVKVNDFELQERLGATSKYPKWAIAYKYPNAEAQTEMIDVEWNTTQSGRVVPVAIYSAVQFNGVTCTRANLDNYKNFLALGLREGSQIIVTRNNDVIPRLNKVLDWGEGIRFEAPTECPSCGYLLEVVTSKQSADLVCNNSSLCESQIALRCVRLFAKRTLDVDGIGLVKVISLMSTLDIKKPADLLLAPKRLLGDKIYNRIKEIKAGVPLYVLIKALGLPGIELSRAKKLAKVIPNDVSLLGWLSNPDMVKTVPGFGPGLTFGIKNALQDELFLDNAKELIKAIRVIYTEDINNDLVICVTGSLGLTRDELKNHLANFNIELADKVTKECNFLVIGEKSGQSKVLKATELGIPMINAVGVTSVDSLITLIKAGVTQ